MEDGSGARLTPFGVTLVAALVLGLAGVFLASSHTLQVIGFIVVTAVLIIGLVEFRPKRAGGRPESLRMRSNYVPGTGRVIDPTWKEDSAPGRQEPEAEPERRPGRGA
jgi:membrane protein implicated in regulation of membrane protease activity